MQKTSYHIYIIKEHYDDELGAAVQRWSLCGKLFSRRLALYRARLLALRERYTKIEVIGRSYDRRGALTSKVIWRHARDKTCLGLRLRHKASLLRWSRRSDKAA